MPPGRATPRGQRTAGSGKGGVAQLRPDAEHVPVRVSHARLAHAPGLIFGRDSQSTNEAVHVINVEVDLRSRCVVQTMLREGIGERDGPGEDNDSVATHAVIVADTEGVIRQFDAGAEAIFGYPSQAAIGRSLNLLVPEHLQEAHWTGFHRAMTSPKVKDLAADLPVRCADGQLHTFPGRLLVLSDGLGVALGAMAIYTSEGTTGVPTVRIGILDRPR